MGAVAIQLALDLRHPRFTCASGPVLAASTPGSEARFLGPRRAKHVPIWYSPGAMVQLRIPCVSAAMEADLSPRARSGMCGSPRGCAVSRIVDSSDAVRRGWTRIEPAAPENVDSRPPKATHLSAKARRLRLCSGPRGSPDIPSAARDRRRTRVGGPESVHFLGSTPVVTAQRLAGRLAQLLRAVRRGGVRRARDRRSGAGVLPA